MFESYRTPNSRYARFVAVDVLDAVEIFTGVVEGLGLAVIADGQINEPDLVLLGIDEQHVLGSRPDFCGDTS